MVFSRMCGAVAVSSVICVGLPNDRYVNSVGKVPKYFGVDSRLTTQDRYKVRLSTRNIDRQEQGVGRRVQ